MLCEDEEGETQKVGQLTGPLGWGTVPLGLSISLDELAIGFSLGLLGLPTITALIFIAVQAFLVAQLGLRIGSRATETVREGQRSSSASAWSPLGCSCWPRRCWPDESRASALHEKH